MLLLNKFFDNPAVVAFMSGVTVDFTLNESAPALTQTQKVYLSGQAGEPIVSLASVKQVHGCEVVIADEYFVNQPLKEADALTVLKFLDKRAAAPVAKLIASAAANAEKQGQDTKGLFIVGITVDKGIVAKRFMP